jgi:hypothetical protein
LASTAAAGSPGTGGGPAQAASNAGKIVVKISFFIVRSLKTAGSSENCSQHGIHAALFPLYFRVWSSDQFFLKFTMCRVPTPRTAC